jgi:hypothetical protein
MTKRALISMMLAFYFLSVVLTVICYREPDVTCGILAGLLFVVASVLLWQLSRKYRSEKRGILVSFGLLLLSLFIPIEH